MDSNLFDELVTSVEQAGAIRRDEIAPSRIFEFSAMDVKAIRESTGRTQEAFAQMLGTSVSAIRSWEQGQRQPTGTARVLLAMFKADPDTAQSLLEKAASHP
ncbi:MAG: helix-turn-helix domain-containing protein [Amphritea sp.]|nr:helix-turn-helix domain-containing protein [Amphritea sp.]